MSSSILKSKAPLSLMGATKVVCQTPLFSTKTLAIPGIQTTTMFVWHPHYVGMVEHRR